MVFEHDAQNSVIVYGLCENERSSDMDKVKELFEYLEEALEFFQMLRGLGGSERKGHGQSRWF